MTITAWERFLHSITGWSTYTLPNAERVQVPKGRSLVRESVPYDWPEAFRGLTYRTGKLWTANWKGVGPDMRFFITHPTYGIRLVITDGVTVIDAGVTNVFNQLRPGEVGGEMHPAEFDRFCKQYPGGRIALPNLPA